MRRCIRALAAVLIALPAVTLTACEAPDEENNGQETEVEEEEADED